MRRLLCFSTYLSDGEVVEDGKFAQRVHLQPPNPFEMHHDLVEDGERLE